MLEEKDLQEIKSIVEDVVDKRVTESERQYCFIVKDVRWIVKACRRT